MKIRWPLISWLLGACVAMPALGQAGPGGGGGGGGGGQGGLQQMDPAVIQQWVAQMQQRILDNIKTQLGSSDDEFQALQPYVLKVLQLQMAGAMSRFGGMRMGGQSLSSILNAGQPPTELQTASAELQAAIDDSTTPPGVIESKLAALRAARAKAKDDLNFAQDNLRQLLTERQEAQLVVMGLLQ